MFHLSVALCLETGFCIAGVVALL